MRLGLDDGDDVARAEEEDVDALLLASPLAVELVVVVPDAVEPLSALLLVLFIAFDATALVTSSFVLAVVVDVAVTAAGSASAASVADEDTTE